jgi:hypothetical protein
MFFLSFKIAAPRPIEVNFVALGLKSLASPDLSDPSTYPILNYKILLSIQLIDLKPVKYRTNLVLMSILLDLNFLES